MFIKDVTEMLLELSRQDGLKKGLKEGLKEGDLNARREISMNLLELGLSTYIIAKASGLLEQDIHSLRDGPRRNEAV
ncbi:MAG: hypothetical protein LBR53_10705 [Deltaproteobacteria bacterium]|jgi:predicted transposase YdaD|nr:hypothetical protein [Deltaproteobacteria bacterium]